MLIQSTVLDPVQRLKKKKKAQPFSYSDLWSYKDWEQRGNIWGGLWGVEVSYPELWKFELHAENSMRKVAKGSAYYLHMAGAYSEK